MNACKVHACKTCQPLRENTVITPARAHVLQAGRPIKVLSSCCCFQACADMPHVQLYATSMLLPGLGVNSCCGLLIVLMRVQTARLDAGCAPVSPTEDRTLCCDLCQPLRCAVSVSAAAASPAKLTIALLKTALRSASLISAARSRRSVARLEVRDMTHARRAMPLFDSPGAMHPVQEPHGCGL